ncbi:MAG: ATP-binding protein [Desulfobulbaceae bacterium]|nr:ATP-binding protein [Desulfobulbaceae bacterium]
MAESLTASEHDAAETALVEARARKRRRIRFVILLCCVLIPIFTYLETKVFQIGAVSFPISGNVLVFVLINVNILLLLLMVFLVLRNLAQLIFERRRKFLGTGLRTKLVISFVSLSLIPTALLFFIALQFVSTSMDYWFNINVEQSLLASLDIGKEVYQGARGRVGALGNNLARRLEREGGRYADGAPMTEHLQDLLESYNLASLQIVTEQRMALAEAYAQGIYPAEVPEVPMEQLRAVLAGTGGEAMDINEVAAGELVRGVTALRLPGVDGKPRPCVLVASLLIPRARLERMHVISRGLEGYRQLMLLKTPIKTSLLVMLLIVTLLIVFAAIWFGFYVARGLTVPIGKLADATRRVAEGELDFVLEKSSGDEMGTLVDSFNRMTRDLLAHKHQIEEANLALQAGNQELDQRRRYTEIILRNVAAGVISVDEKGRVTTINRFAEELLGISHAQVLGRDYHAILRPEHLAILDGFLGELAESGKGSMQRPLRLTVRDETFFLRVNFTRLEDEEGRPLGVVLVFDNLTELEKAQRMAAWREVARRIAHEVKNPLTPIQLSAQRLRKRYLDRIEGEREVFDLCTKTIINQVEELKRLVSEFSSFARMPSVQKSVNLLPEMVQEVLALYREAHKHVAFRFIDDPAVPAFSFDRKQLKRVLINLIDNAVAVLPAAGGGEVEVRLAFDAEGQRVFVEVRDNGPGIAEADKLRLFEPYFSTKKSGTGLGLAIATTVVADHGGYLRVKDNEPAGSRFIIELPLKSEE